MLKQLLKNRECVQGAQDPIRKSFQLPKVEHFEQSKSTLNYNPKNTAST